MVWSGHRSWSLMHHILFASDLCKKIIKRLKVIIVYGIRKKKKSVVWSYLKTQKSVKGRNFVKLIRFLCTSCWLLIKLSLFSSLSCLIIEVWPQSSIATCMYVCVCEHSKWVDITILLYHSQHRLYIKSDTTAISHATCKKNDFFLTALALPFA